MRTIPFTLPSAHVSAPGVVSVPDVDTGGYDFMVGGFGFRLATDQQFAYTRGTEPTTTHRFDSSLEPGEQSLSPIPWIKSQSSFHAGAGQLNLEQGFTAFQYQQEQVEHIRFDSSLGVDVWTPGQVTRLPDTRFFNFGFNAACSITAEVNGVDYAIIGGNGGLWQAAWTSGPDADPVVTRISLVNSTYVNDANCNVTSLTTDGSNYYGVVQMTSVGYNNLVLTYVIAGQVNSTSTPEAIYQVPNLSLGPAYHNLCTNPSFENNTTGWQTYKLAGLPGSGGTLTRSTTQQFVGAASGKYVAVGGANANVNFNNWGEGCNLQISGVTAGQIYTVSCYIYVDGTGPSPTMQQVVASDINSFTPRLRGSATSATNTWQRVEMTFTANDTTIYVGFSNAQGTTSTAGSICYFDGFKVEQASWSALNYFDGDTLDTASYNYIWDGAAGNSSSTAVPLTVTAQTPSIVGWNKARLVGLLGRGMYELDPSAPVHSVLPDPNYVSPSPGWTWTAVAESPTGILASGAAGNQTSILEFTLDTSGGVPILTGGSSVAQLPVGEQINSMEAVLGAWLAMATSEGVRVGTFDTYTGRLKVGPLSINTNASCLDVATRDRFVYGGYTNQQADGKTGLVRLDLSMEVDVAGRLAYAADLRPPTSAPTGLGAVTSLNILPLSGRMVFLTPEGIHVEGNGPGTNGSAWLRTSRIRWDTAEMKLFKLGRVHGALDLANIQITGIAPYGVTQNLGTFGFISNEDPGEFRLIGGTNEWMQLQFELDGAGALLNSYQVKAYPAPARQHLIELTANCFTNEVDRFGLEVSDPQTPRTRLQNVQNLEQLGNEIRFVEFTNFGAVAQLVVIDQLEFRSYSRPNVEDDFGGYITFRLRTTEN